MAASGLSAAPRGISDYRSRPVSGLVGIGRIAFPRTCARSGWTSGRTWSSGIGRWLIRPRSLTVAGAAEAWVRSGPHLFPVSPRREECAGTPGTSALIVQHKLPAPVRESTLKRNPYTLT